MNDRGTNNSTETAAARLDQAASRQQTVEDSSDNDSLFGDDAPEETTAAATKQSALSDDLFGDDDIGNNVLAAGTDRQRHIIKDDDDDEEDEEEDGNLFGDDSAEEEESEMYTSRASGEQDDTVDDDQMLMDMDASVQAPPLSVNLKREAPPESGEDPPEYYLARLPKYYRIDAKPFSAATYEPEALANMKRFGDEAHNGQHDNDAADGGDAQVSAAESARRARQLRLRVKGTLRWRIRPAANPSQPPKVESNAKMVRWSDGSWSMMVNGELFDLDRKAMAHEHHYAVTHHPSEGVLRVEKRLSSHLAFRPTSATGLATAVEATAIDQKKQTQAMLVMEDPEKLQRQMAEVEKQRIRHARRLAAVEQARSVRRDSGRYRQESSGLTIEDLEAEEYDDLPDDSYGRGSYRSDRRGRDDADLEGFIVGDDDEEEDEEDEDVDNNEEDVAISAGRHRRRTRQYSDDDDDDDDAAERLEEPAEEMDELERMEQQLAKRSTRTYDDDSDQSAGGDAPTRRSRDAASASAVPMDSDSE